MIYPVRRIGEEDLNYKEKKEDNILISAQISDIHFGAMDPLYQYNTLYTQFILELYKLNKLDFISINGDLFDRKFPNTSEPVLYAIKFVHDLVLLCKEKNASLVIIHGTESHDAGQLKLFYHYLDDKSLDIHIIESARFIYIKGAKILIIPEEYDKPKEYYEKIMYFSGEYDMALMHGTYKNAVRFGKDLSNKRYPIFDIDSFIMCRSCIISGHIHSAGCFDKYFYYTGQPYRWQFGDESDKGFMIAINNITTHTHYVHFQKINCMRFDTINIDDLLNSDPDKIISYINDLKEKENIDYLRVRVSKLIYPEALGVLDILKSHFKGNSRVVVKDETKQDEIAINKAKSFLQNNKQFEFILDNSLTPEEIFVKYVNIKEGYEYINSEELKKILLD